MLPECRGDLDLGRVAVSALGDWAGELLDEGGQGPQLPRVDEVEETPELLEVVLERGARQDEAVRSCYLFHLQVKKVHLNIFFWSGV